MKKMQLLAVAICATGLLAAPASAAQRESPPTVTLHETGASRPGGISYCLLVVRVDGLSPGEVIEISITDITSDPAVKYPPAPDTADASGVAVAGPLVGNYSTSPTQYEVSIFFPARSFSLTRWVTLDCAPDQALLPTAKDQCKNEGWRSFGVFKNQGDCVSFVATGGRAGL